jgi:hypothetical protein
MIDEILDPDTQGFVKRASALSTKATRTTIREEGFQRAIIPFENIKDGDLDYFGNSELPGKWFELEPDSPPARMVPYYATPNTFVYDAKKYVVLISPIITEEATKNVNELRTYRTDLRTTVQDNMLRDIHAAEDTGLVAQFNRIVGNAVALSAAPDVEVQNIDMETGWSRASVARAQSFMIDRHCPLGINLVNQRTANEFLAWHRDEVGGDLAQDLLKKGLKAMDKFEIMGMPWLSTIKNWLVPNGYVFQFGTPEWLGHALMLEDITVIIKKEYDFIRTRAQEQVGITFGNTRPLQKIRYRIGN